MESGKERTPLGRSPSRSSALWQPPPGPAGTTHRYGDGLNPAAFLGQAWNPTSGLGSGPRVLGMIPGGCGVGVGGPLSFFFLNYYFILFYFFLLINLFIYGCVGSSFLCEGSPQLRQAGATLHRGARASHHRGLPCCRAPDAQAQQLWPTGPAAPRHAGSSQTRARTHVPCIGRQTPNHCATREALFYFLINVFIYLFLATLGLSCCARAFSSCGERGPLFVAVRGLLIVVASLVVDHGL